MIEFKSKITKITEQTKPLQSNLKIIEKNVVGFEKEMNLKETKEVREANVGIKSNLGAFDLS